MFALKARWWPAWWGRTTQARHVEARVADGLDINRLRVAVNLTERAHTERESWQAAVSFVTACGCGCVSWARENAPACGTPRLPLLNNTPHRPA